MIKRNLWIYNGSVNFSRDTSGSAIHADKQIAIDAPIYEQYIDLLCQFRPQDVYNFIMVNEGYRLEPTLEVTRQHFTCLQIREGTGMRQIFFLFQHEYICCGYSREAPRLLENISNICFCAGISKISILFAGKIKASYLEPSSL